MAERTGVDIILRGKDETADAFAAAGRRIDKIVADAARAQGGQEGVGGKIGKSIGNQILGGMAAGLGGRAIDQLFRDINAAQAAGRAGAELAHSLAESAASALRDIPIAGSVGQLLAANIFDPLMWGEMAREASRKAMMEAGNAQVGAAERAARSSAEVIADLDAKAMSDRARRRADFEKAQGPRLSAIQAASGLSAMVAARAMEDAAFARSENLIAEREQLAKEAVERDEQARKMQDERREAAREAEMATREEARAEAERMGLAERALARMRDLRNQNTDAEVRLAGAVEFGRFNAAAARFRREREITPTAAKNTQAAQLREQQLAKKVLDDMLEEARQQSEALRRIAESPQILEISQL